MLRKTHNLLATVAAIAAVSLCACGAPRAGEKAPPASAKEWQEALAAIRKIALDRSATETHRAQAVAAYVKLQLGKGRPDDAMTFCQTVLKRTAATAVLDAALRAGCLIERNRRGHLRAELDFLASWSKGAGAPAAAVLRRELMRASEALRALAARPMVPEPVPLRLPHWAAAGPGRAPSALHGALPRMQLPSWVPRVAFPLLKEPKKK